MGERSAAQKHPSSLAVVSYTDTVPWQAAGLFFRVQALLFSSVMLRRAEKVSSLVYFVVGRCRGRSQKGCSGVPEGLMSPSGLAASQGGRGCVRRPLRRLALRGKACRELIAKDATFTWSGSLLNT